MRKSSFFFLLFSFSGIFFANAQDFQGKATYQIKTKINFDNGEEPLTERQLRMQESLKNRPPLVFALFFDKKASIYERKEVVRLEGARGGDSRGGSRGGSGGGFGRMFSGGGASNKILYRDTKNRESITEVEFLTKKFLIKEVSGTLDWKMEGESKVIGKYTCFKAIAKKQVPNVDFSSMISSSTENQEKEIEEFKEIDVVAWYTLDIPVNHGPDEYWGLPGLIIMVNAGNTQFVCSEITMNPKERKTIEAPKRGDKVSREAYDKIVAKKTKELLELRGSRGGPGGGGRGGSGGGGRGGR